MSGSCGKWGLDDSQTPILHVDMDAFFASVEVAENPLFRGKPLIVGGTGNRGVVTSATYEARASGVKAGQPIVQAKSLCPAATVLPGRHALYVDYSHKVMDVLSSFTQVFEKLSIDEAFLDVSGAIRRLGTPVEIAKQLRKQVRKEVGIPASVGISSVKSVAKIASGCAKPDGWLLVSANQTVPFLHSLSVGALWGVGKKTKMLLNAKGIVTVEELAHCDVGELRRWLGDAQAFKLHDMSWGRDKREVGPPEREKSVSIERTFEVNIVSTAELERFVLGAAHGCTRRLREVGLLGWTVTLKLRDSHFKTVTRSKTLIAPTDVGRVVADAVLNLARRQRIPQGGIRLAGVSVSSLEAREEGISVLLDHDPRDRDVELAMDRAHGRFGANILKPASLLVNEIASK